MSDVALQILQIDFKPNCLHSFSLHSTQEVKGDDKLTCDEICMNFYRLSIYLHNKYLQFYGLYGNPMDFDVIHRTSIIIS